MVNRIVDFGHVKPIANGKAEIWGGRNQNHKLVSVVAAPKGKQMLVELRVQERGDGIDNLIVLR